MEYLLILQNAPLSRDTCCDLEGGRKMFTTNTLQSSTSQSLWTRRWRSGIDY